MQEACNCRHGKQLEELSNEGSAGEGDEMTSEARKPIFWTLNEKAQHLSATTLQEAALDVVSSRGWQSPGDGKGYLFTAYGYARAELPSVESMRDDILEHMAEYLDDEYGDPDGARWTPYGDVVDAAAELAKRIRDGYEPWRCDRVEERTFTAEELWRLAHGEATR